MDEESKHILERVLRATEENHRLLKKIRRASVIGSFFRLVYWVVIIGISIGLFYYLKPFTEQLMEAYGSFSGGIKNIRNFAE